MVLVNRTAVSFGSIPLAVMGVIFRAMSFVFMPCVGIGQGMMPLIGFNFGAGKLLRVGETVIKGGLASTVWSTLWWGIVLLFPVPIISIFNNDPEFIKVGSEAIRIFGLAMFAIGIQISSSFFFQGIGRGLPSLVLASARQVLFLLPCLLILPRIFGLTGLWVSFPVADGISVILTLIWVGIQFRKMGIPIRWKSTDSSPEEVRQQ